MISTKLKLCCKNFNILAISEHTNYLHTNYFDNSIKLFLHLYLIKFLDTSAKSFFPYCETVHCNL